MKIALSIITLTLLLSGCAHRFMRGTVAMKINNKTAHVCLGDMDVKLGDTVEFYSNKCTQNRTSTDGVDQTECKLEILGTGDITKLLNKHYSEVTTNGKFNIQEGTLVQKQK